MCPGNHLEDVLTLIELLIGTITAGIVLVISEISCLG